MNDAQLLFLHMMRKAYGELYDLCGAQVDCKECPLFENGQPCAKDQLEQKIVEFIKKGEIA